MKSQPPQQDSSGPLVTLQGSEEIEGLPVGTYVDIVVQHDALTDSGHPEITVSAGGAGRVLPESLTGNSFAVRVTNQAAGFYGGSPITVDWTRSGASAS